MGETNKNTLGFFTGLGYWTRGNPEMCLLVKVDFKKD